MDIQNPLLLAAVRGDAETILRDATLEDVTAKFGLGEDCGVFHEGLTLLMVAAGSPWSNIETTQALLSKGAKLDEISSGGVTATWYAAAGIPEPFLDKSLPRRIEDRWYKGKGNSSILEHFLELGANPNESAANDRGLLSEACGCGNAASVRLLLAAGANPNPRGNQPSSADLARDHSVDLIGDVLGQEVIQAISEFWKEPNIDPELNSGLYAGVIPLHQAAEADCIECIKALLESGTLPDIRDSDGNTALTSAGSPEMLEFLLSSGTSIVTEGTFGDAVDRLLDDQKYEVARALLKRGAPLDSTAWGASRAHSFAGTRMDVEALKVFMECGGDIHTPSYSGGTILHTACWQGLYSEDSDRPPAITCAMMEFLIKQNIPLDAVDRNGDSALHEAIDGDWENPLAVEILLEHRANPDIPNHQGLTPLMLAADGRPESVGLLLRFGANVRLMDKAGRTALDHALESISQRDRQGVLTKLRLDFSRRTLEKRMPDTDFDAINDELLRDAARCAHLIHEAMVNSEN